jgi:hypothetical protein
MVAIVDWGDWWTAVPSIRHRRGAHPGRFGNLSYVAARIAATAGAGVSQRPAGLPPVARGGRGPCWRPGSLPWVVRAPARSDGNGLPANPLGVDGAEQLRERIGPVLGLLFMLLVVLVLVSPVRRFRRAWCDERRQLKWFTFAAALTAVLPPTFGVPAEQVDYPMVRGVFFSLAIVMDGSLDARSCLILAIRIRRRESSATADDYACGGVDRRFGASTQVAEHDAERGGRPE